MPRIAVIVNYGGFKGMKIARNMDGATRYVDYVLKRTAS